MHKSESVGDPECHKGMKAGASYDFFADVAPLCFTARHGAW